MIVETLAEIGTQLFFIAKTFVRRGVVTKIVINIDKEQKPTITYHIESPEKEDKYLSYVRREEYVSISQETLFEKIKIKT